MEGRRFQGLTGPQPVEKISRLVGLKGDGGGDCFPWTISDRHRNPFSKARHLDGNHWAR